MNGSLTQPVSGCTLACEGPRASEGSGGQNAPGKVAPIDLLPNELLLVVFKLYISPNIPARDLVVLSLVCKRWQNVAEGTASLWCRISGRDGLPGLRKALTMARDVPLEIKYFKGVAKTDTETFLAHIGGQIAQCKSLDISTSDWDPVLATLKQANTPNLRTLRLAVPWNQGWKESVITLFGGEPAPAELKDLHVEYIPLAIAPLRLSGIRSLVLKGRPIVSTEEVLRLLGESPALEKCDLHNLRSLRNSNIAIPSHVLQGRTDYPIIQLSRLRSLDIRNLHLSITHFILSVIRAPKLRKVSVDCTIDQLDQSPGSDLFTTKISHLIPSFKDLVKTAKRIEMFSHNVRYWTISIGRLMIGLAGRRPRQLSHLQETLDWVFRNLGGHLRALPVSLKVFEFGIARDWFIWFGSYLKVTKLELRTLDLPVQPRRREMVSLLSRPLESADNQWLMPELKAIKIDVVDEDSKSEIVEMVNARHSWIDEQGVQRSGAVGLKPFQEIWLGHEGHYVSKELGPNLEFLMAVQKAGRGAEIWWEDAKWTGAEDAGRVGEVEGNA
ncbi:hypothetical protein FRC05_002860 [Tulasnella sp. 425]|nr:hypothetical protein FRC05_002860 [Tulasnella sp. 425]